MLLPYTQRTVTERPGGRGGRDRGERTLDSVPTEAPRPRPSADVPAPAAPDEALALVEQAEADAGAGVDVEVVVEPPEAGADG